MLIDREELDCPKNTQSLKGLAPRLIPLFITKIAGRKRPVLVDPLHKVRQGGKGYVWDGQTDGHFQSTSGKLPVTSSPLPVHFWSIWAP